MKEYWYIGADVKGSSVGMEGAKTVAVWFPQSFASKQEACVKCAELMASAHNCQRFFIAAWQKQLKLDEHHVSLGFIEEGK
jgi:hypothetical protein